MEQQQSGAHIGRRAFISAALILLVLMIGAGILTRLVPAGQYQRTVQDEREVLDPTSFNLTQARPLPVWRWFTAPVEVLGSSDAVMVITIILFILVVGGSFPVLDHAGVIHTIIASIVTRFRSRRYVLIAVVCLFFMAMGALLGFFEETVPLIPIVVALAWSMGWDSLTGLGMSLLATGFGFSAAIANPFSIGVAQGIAGLPLFSGAWFRIIVFAVMYVLVATFVILHARHVEHESPTNLAWPEEQAARARYRQSSDDVTFVTPRCAVTWSVCCLGAMLAVVLLGPLVPALQTYSLPIIGLSIEILHAPATRQAQHMLLMTTGEHGIEGFVGSAIMELAIREVLPQLDPATTSLCLVHAINPWGMKHEQHTDAANVDLNRNFVVSWDSAGRANDGYRSLRCIFQPQGPVPSVQWNHLLPTGQVMRLAATGKSGMLRQALLAGQYEEPAGLYYGGTE